MKLTATLLLLLTLSACGTITVTKKEQCMGGGAVGGALLAGVIGAAVGAVAGHVACN